MQKQFYESQDVSAAAIRYGWPALLMRFGIDQSFLRNIHGPCPGCGGRDRFRFDDNEGRGTFICSQGGGDILSGDGITLLMHVKSWDFLQVLRELGDFLEVSKSERPTSAPRPPPKPIIDEEKPAFSENSLKSFAARWRPHVSTAWLADRSAISPFNVSAADFLRFLYHPAEKVLVFTNHTSQGDAVWPRDKLPAGGPEGVWFLIQPVDGKVYPNPRSIDKDTGQPKLSRRSEESVSSWRFLLLESDKADPRDWLGAIVQFSLPVAAIYTSGGRSIHVLLRVDAESLAELRDYARSVLRPIFVKLGADNQVANTAVRLSRLPGCLRADQLQKLLYLNPNAPVKQICAIPPARNTIKVLQSAALNFLPIGRAAAVIEAANAKSLDEVSAALAKHENFCRDVDISRADLIRALEWFSTAPECRELLVKLRGK